MSDFLNKYPYTDFHELNLDWVIERVKKLTEDWAATLEEWNDTEEQWQDLYNYVHDYFDNLNLQAEVNVKLNSMVSDGTFQQIATPIIQAKVSSDLPNVVSNQIGSVVASQIDGTVAGQIDASVARQIMPNVATAAAEWLEDNITQPTTPVVDASLSVSGAAADAKVTGDWLRGLGSSNVEYFSDEQQKSGSGPWETLTINLPITPQEGTYYLKIGSITDGLTEQCAAFQSYIGGTMYTEVLMTQTDITNGDSIALPVNSSITSLVLKLFRNASPSPGTVGTTTWNDIQITFGSSDVIYSLDKDVNLYDNDDFSEVAQTNQSAGFSPEVHDIYTDGMGCNEVVFDWLTEKYFIYFNRDVFLESINPKFTSSGKAVTCTLMRGSNDTLSNGDALTFEENITGVTGTPIQFNRIIRKNEIIKFYCADASIIAADVRYNRGCFDYAPKFGYAMSGNTVSNINDNEWGIYRGIGEFIIHETYDFLREYSNYWMGKTVLWLGTSIPEGGYLGNKMSSYPDIVGKKIGAAVHNECLGSSSISRRVPNAVAANNPYGFDTTDFEFAWKCLCDNLTIKNWLISNYNNGFFLSNVPPTMSTSLANQIRNASFENKVDNYLPGGQVGNVDLYVFDHGYNDSMNRDTETLESQYGRDTTYCFDGGMNFLINRILVANPDAKIVIISHYTNNAACGSNPAEFSAEVIEAQKKVSERWSVKFINIYEDLGWSGQTVQTTGYWDASNVWVVSGGATQAISVKNMHVRDTVHPFTDASGKSNNRIADIIAAEIKNMIR